MTDDWPLAQMWAYARTIRLAFRTTGDVTVRMELDVEPGYADGMSLGPPGAHFVVRPSSVTPREGDSQ